MMRRRTTHSSLNERLSNLLGSGSRRSRSAASPRRQPLLEGLENRRLFALLGIQSMLGFPDLRSDVPGSVNYTAGAGAAGLLTSTSTTIAVQTSPTTGALVAPSDRVPE